VAARRGATFTLFDTRVIADPELVEDRRVPLVITPPLRGPGWFSADGWLRRDLDPSRPAPRRGWSPVHQAGDFAIDWVRFQGGRLFTGDGTQNEQWFAFAEVVSVADRTVVAVRDDMPEEAPNQPPVGVYQFQDYAGNHVIVQIIPDAWAAYAHLRPGSVTVRVGERVTAGRQLGRLGSSGNSTAPHLHFQLSDGPDVLTSHSLPYVFDRCTLGGAVDPEALGAAFTVPSAPPVRIVGPPVVQNGACPLVVTVQEFP
jgi:hypothetical protein